MSQHHARILKEMLDNDILPLGQRPDPSQGSKSDQGRGESLPDSSLALPAPEVGLKRSLTGKRVERAVGHFKGADFRTETNSRRGNSSGPRGHSAHPSKPISHSPGGHGGEGPPVGSL